MSRIKWVVAVAMGLALTTAAWAQDAPPDRARPERPRAERARADRPPGERPAPMRDGPIDPKVALERLTNALGLSEEQQTQVKQILETHAQAVANWTKEHGGEARALREEMAKAREAKDEAKMKELAEKAKALGEGRRKLQDGLHDQIAGVLTEEQKAKWEKMRPAGPGPAPVAMRLRAAVGQLGLSDEQVPQVRKIYQAAEEAAKQAEGPEAKAAILRKANEDVLALLTDEQKAKLEKLRAGPGPEGPPPPRPFAELGLTEEQQKQVQAIVQDARVKAKDATPEERAEIQRAAFEKIRSEVLTEEQKAKAKEMRLRRAGERERPRARPERFAPAAPERPAE